MQNFALIKSLLSEPWCVSAEVTERYSFLLESLLNPAIAAEPISEARQASVSTIVPVSQSQGGSIAHSVGCVSIIGPLTKYGTACEYGMVDYSSMIAELDQNPKVSAIIVSIDSPGGMVNGTAELAATIRQTTKPTIAFVSDLAASAGYFIAAAADEIIANIPTAEVGSIGVMTNLINYSEYYKKNGIKMNARYAKQSTRKNEESREAEKGNFDLIDEKLTVVAEDFINHIIASRPNVTQEQLTGALFFAKDAVGTLVDSIGDFNYAVNRAINLASELAFTKSNNNNLSMKTTPNLNAVLEVSELASQDGQISLSEEQVEAIEAALGAPALEATTESTSAEEATEEASEDSGELSALRAENSALRAENSALEGEVENLTASLKKRPAVASAYVSTDVDSASEAQHDPCSALNEAAASARKYL